MVCFKCNGWMFQERFSDPLSDAPDFQGWHCPVCGLIIDPLILFNRVHPPAPSPGGNRNLKSMGKMGFLRKKIALQG
jgi:hypothetical protein